MKFSKLLSFFFYQILLWEKIWENWEKIRNTKTEPLGMPQSTIQEKDKVSLLHGRNYMALFLGITTSISNRLLQTKLSNIISLGYTIFWNGTKFMWTLPFLHAVSFLPILLSTVSTQGTGNVFLYERSISEYHKDVKISRVQMPY